MAPVRRAKVRAFWAWAVPLVLVASDLAALVASSVAAYVLAASVHTLVGIGNYVDAFEVADDRLGQFGVVSVGALTWFMAHGHHRSRKPFWHEAKEVCVVSLFCLMAEGFLAFAHKGDISRLLVILTWMIAPFAIMSGRHLLKSLLRSRGLFISRALVFGQSKEASHAVEALMADPHLGYRVLGMQPIIPGEEAVALVHAAGADVAVVALTNDASPGSHLAEALSTAGIPLIVVPPVSGIPVAGMQAQYVVGIDTILLVDHSDPAGNLTKVAKRGFDICVSGAILAVAAVPLLALAALVAVDGGSPFFGHERVGMGGRRFRCLKLRTMVRNPEEVLARHLEANPAARVEWERDRKLRDDPRVTRLGSILRKSALDELPQLVNVLKGDMSLVGPRPITPEELGRYGDAAVRYLAVRPGITGLWQVSGRNDVSYEHRVALDAWYVRNWSAWNDLVILVRTVPALLSRRGAY